MDHVARTPRCLSASCVRLACTGIRGGRCRLAHAYATRVPSPMVAPDSPNTLILICIISKFRAGSRGHGGYDPSIWVKSPNRPPGPPTTTATGAAPDRLPRSVLDTVSGGRCPTCPCLSWPNTSIRRREKYFTMRRNLVSIYWGWVVICPTTIGGFTPPGQPRKNTTRAKYPCFQRITKPRRFGTHHAVTVPSVLRAEQAKGITSCVTCSSSPPS